MNIEKTNLNRIIKLQQNKAGKTIMGSLSAQLLRAELNTQIILHYICNFVQTSGSPTVKCVWNTDNPEILIIIILAITVAMQMMYTS